MYTQRDGTLAEAKVTSVDRSVKPYIYGIVMEHTGAERETEGVFGAGC